MPAAHPDAIAFNFLARQEMQKFESRCSLATQQLERARTMPEIVRAADVHAPSWMHSLTRHARTVLTQKAERKAEALLEVQTKELEALEGDAREKQLNRLRREWESLRGHFPRLAVKAQRVR